MYLQFISTLETNVEALTGSPVKVTIDSVSGGSAVVTETYAFLDNSATSATNLATVLTSSDSSSVFGTTFGPVTVAASSVKTGTVANPSSKHSCWCDQADTLMQCCKFAQLTCTAGQCRESNASSSQNF